MTHKNQSHLEREVVNFIGLNNVLVNRRDIIPPLELDIFLPDYNFAIEFNGDFWHSKYDKAYHLNKTKKAEKKGIHLFHIWQSEWNNATKQTIWKSLINAKLGRNTLVKTSEVREVEDTKIFLNDNHLEGFTKSSKNLGLFYEDELVALACFTGDKLLRFCTKSGLYVKDAFEILLKTYGQDVTYLANRRWNHFKDHQAVEPNYYWLKVHSNMLFPSSTDIRGLLGHYDHSKTEYKNIVANGYRILWDCGNWLVKWKSASKKTSPHTIMDCE